MNENFTDILDIATGRLMAGESLADILADYPAHADELNRLLHAVSSLDTLHPVEMPAPEDLHLDRNKFLTTAINLRTQPVSLTPMERLKAWIVHYLPTFNLVYPRKEQWRMSTLLIKAMVVFGVIFSSVGGTAAYAAQSLPGSPVYPLKLTMEDARMALTSDPVDQANLHLAMAQTRTQEMEQLIQQGKVPDEPTLHRLQNHINQAFQLAAQLPDEQMQGVLTQAQTMLQTEEQRMAQTQTMAGEPAQEPVKQAQQLLQQARQAAQTGVNEPKAFRFSFQRGNPESPGGPPVDDEPVDDEPVDDEPVDDEPVDDEPVDDEPVDDEPVDDEPVDDEPNQYQQQHQNQYSEGSPCQGDDCDPSQGPIQHQREHEYQHSQGPNEPQADPTCVGDCDPAPNANQHQNGVETEPVDEEPIDDEPVVDEPIEEPTVPTQSDDTNKGNGGSTNNSSGSDSGNSGGNSGGGGNSKGGGKK